MGLFNMIFFYPFDLVHNVCLFRSIHEGVSSAIMNSDCLVFDTSIAQVMLFDPCASTEMLSFQLFADNGNLGINVTISMC